MTPAEHLALALEGLGFSGDPEMARTPELLCGLLAEFQPRPLPALDPLLTESQDLLVVRDVPYYSLCAHHLLPFFGAVTLVIRPDGRITGLGALIRLVEALSRRPQLQERLAAQLADAIHRALAPRSVGVRLSARQLCVEMRGARVPATFEVTALRGEEDAGVDAAIRA